MEHYGQHVGLISNINCNYIQIGINAKFCTLKKVQSKQSFIIRKNTMSNKIVNLNIEFFLGYSKTR